MGARAALSLSTSVFSVSEGKGTPRLGGALSRRDSTDGGTSSARLRCGSTSWNLRSVCHFSPASAATRPAGLCFGSTSWNR